MVCTTKFVLLIIKVAVLAVLTIKTIGRDDLSLNRNF